MVEVEGRLPLCATDLDGRRRVGERLTAIGRLLRAVDDDRCDVGRMIGRADHDVAFELGSHVGCFSLREGVGWETCRAGSDAGC